MNILNSMIGMKINYFTALDFNVKTDTNTAKSIKYLNEYMKKNDMTIAVVQELDSKNSNMLIKNDFAVEILNSSKLIKSYIHILPAKSSNPDYKNMYGRKYNLCQNLFEKYEPIPIENNQINFKPIINFEKFSCALISADVLIANLEKLPIEMANYIKAYQLHDELKNILPKNKAQTSMNKKKGISKI